MTRGATARTRGKDDRMQRIGGARAGRYHAHSIHQPPTQVMKTITKLCVLAGAGLLITACAAETSTDNGGEAMQQVYSTGSNIPRHAPAGAADGVSTMNREEAGRVFTDPQRVPAAPGGAR